MGQFRGARGARSAVGDGGTERDSGTANAGAGRVKQIGWSQLRVLVVEDNRNFQVVISTVLRSLGVRYLALANNGAEGLGALDVDTFDLVLCDWRMDGMDGVEFARHAVGSGAGAQIIMMSGYGNDSIRSQAKANGVNAFLDKPITAHGLHDVVMQVMSA